MNTKDSQKNSNKVKASKSSFSQSNVKLFIWITYFCIAAHLTVKFIPDHKFGHLLHIGYNILLLFQFILLISWTYYTVKNIKRAIPQFKIPSWATVIAWIIPLVNLVLPFYIAHNVWKGWDKLNQQTSSNSLIFTWFIINAISLSIWSTNALHFMDSQYLIDNSLPMWQILLEISFLIFNNLIQIRVVQKTLGKELSAGYAE